MSETCPAPTDDGGPGTPSREHGRVEDPHDGPPMTTRGSGDRPGKLHTSYTGVRETAANAAQRRETKVQVSRRLGASQQVTGDRLSDVVDVPEVVRGLGAARKRQTITTTAASTRSRQGSVSAKHPFD
jgi:hypothetical protein